LNSATVNIADSGSSAVKLRAIADAYLRGGDFANTNFGGDARLRSKYGAAADNSTRESYLRFDLTSVSTITSATLRLYGWLNNNDTLSVPVGIYACTGATCATWSEATITYNNRPVSGMTPLATTTVSGTAGNWYVWDLTAYLQAEKAAGRNVVTLVIKNPSASQNQAVFHSDEAGSNRPELVIA
jgi:endoglucanase